MSIPYLGSRISLISKSGIRYEGILYTIDPAKGQVALQNVRSFGTEGRRQDGQEIPPSPTVYEYIIFRGSDINDLQVCEDPAVPPAGARPPEDPAIISRGPNPYGYPTSGYPAYPPGPGYGYPSGARGPAAPSPSTAPSSTPSSEASEKMESPASDAKHVPTTRSSARPPVDSATGGAGSRDTKNPWGKPRGGGMSAAASSPARARPGARGGGVAVGARGGDSSGQRTRPNTKGRNRPGRADQHPRGTAPAAATPKKLEEFDFEEANAKFDREKVKEELVGEAGGAEHADEPEEPEKGKSTVYNKSTSFFDRIPTPRRSLSCDALDKSEGRDNKVSFSQQRKLDTETFGAAPVKQRRNNQRHNNRRRNYRKNNYQPRRGHSGHAPRTTPT